MLDSPWLIARRPPAPRSAGSAQLRQPRRQHWAIGFLADPLHQLLAPREVGFDLGAVIPVVGEGGVDLAEGEVRVLEGQLLGAPAVGAHLGDQLDHLGVGVGDPGHSVVVDDDVLVGGAAGGSGHREDASAARRPLQAVRPR